MNQLPEISGPVARLAQSRAQLTRLLVSERSAERLGTPAGTAGAGGAFPRSATMRFLCSVPARKAASLLVLGLLNHPSARTLRWIRFLPLTALTRSLLRRFAKRSSKTLSSARSTEVQRGS
jgi:hypothetical protein